MLIMSLDVGKRLINLVKKRYIQGFWNVKVKTVKYLKKSNNMYSSYSR